MANRPKDEAPYNHDIQLEQKLLHYRSELKKFQRIIHLQKKKLTSQEEEIQSFKKSISNQISPHFNEPISNKIQENMAGIYAYFAYSTLFPSSPSKDSEEPCIINGNFIIRNETGLPLHDPLVCLSFNKPELANLSGKINQNKQHYATEHIMADENVLSWNFLEDHSIKKVRETGEFWLRPNKTELVDQEELTFNQFEILLPYHGKPFSVSINGYIYGKEIPEGRRALNAIICNIT